MKTCIVTFLAAGGIWAGAIHSSLAQPSPVATGKPAAIIITNAPAGGKGAKLYLSAGVQEVLKMHEAGVDKSVILAFVQNSSVAYQPSAKEVIHLRDEGVSIEVISAMLKRGGDLRDRAAELQREELRTRQIEQPPPAPAPAVPAQPQPPASAAPQAASVVYASPAVYNTYPTYSYSYVAYPGTAMHGRGMDIRTPVAGLTIGHRSIWAAVRPATHGSDSVLASADTAVDGVSAVGDIAVSSSFDA